MTSESVPVGRDEPGGEGARYRRRPMGETEAWTSVHGLLGTVTDVRIRALDPAASHAAIDAALAEIERLEHVFTVFDDTSDLNRWRRGELDPPSDDLADGLSLATAWRRRSGGVFDPAVAALVACWDRAAERDRHPTAGELAAARADMTDTAPDPANPPPWNLNALAKGLIVDRAVAVAGSIGAVTDVLVNAGGDLRHLGSEPVVVGIEDPFRPFDNAEPTVRVALTDGALATSGGARRGWTIGGRRYSHVLDPRSGHPVDHVSSASVVARDAATADVVATVCSVLAPERGLAFVDSLDALVACLVIGADGRPHRSAGWAAFEITDGELSEG